jgi:trigger factor
MKVTVKEEPAWKRVLDIEVDTDTLSREMDAVVEEYRKRLVLPGFRQGKVPSDVARKTLGGSLENEVLQRIVPRAFAEAVRESGLRPLGDPEFSNLHYHPGEPLRFSVSVEVLPVITVRGYEGMDLTREVAEIGDEDLNRVLDGLREREADLEEVDRPAHGKDVVVIRYRAIASEGGPEPAPEPQEASLEIGGPGTPEVMNRELMGAVVGDMKNIPLTFPPDHPDPERAGTTVSYHVTVAKVQEKIWPPLDDTLARKVLGNETATLDDLRARIRLNLEMEARMRSLRELEDRLLTRLLEMNPFEVPRGVVDGALQEYVEDLKKRHPDLPPQEEDGAREAARRELLSRYRLDILLEAVGRQEKIEVTDEELEGEIAAYASAESKNAAQVRARLKRDGGLDRLRNDIFRRRVVDRLVEKANVTVIQAGRTPGSEGE